LGLGHLRRLSRIAGSLQGRFACLVVTGMAEAQWLVPPKCEFVKLPNWDSLSKVRAERRNRDQWLTVSRTQAQELKQQFLLSIDRVFRPDAVIVDYLPFGVYDELAPVLRETAGVKYLLLRGLVDYCDREVLWGSATGDVANAYDRILVAADRRIVDVASEYGFTRDAAEKVRYVGYMAPTLRDSRTQVNGARCDLVVCGCGGGLGGESIFGACIEAARRSPSADFVIVTGAHGRINPDTLRDIPPNCRICGVHPYLDELHANATVVVTHGGYNSVIEAASGGARVLVHHVSFDENDEDDERIQMEQRLATYYPIRAVDDIDDLPGAIGIELRVAASTERPRLELDLAGLDNIGRVLAADLGLATG
jgi:predicted glycosyltransferase